MNYLDIAQSQYSALDNLHGWSFHVFWQERNNKTDRQQNKQIKRVSVTKNVQKKTREERTGKIG